MNNNDLAEAIAATHNIPKAEARRIIASMLGAIAEAAARGEEVAINGFGKFKVKQSPARQGRNPATGGAIKIPASKKLSFAPAKAIRDRLNG